MPFINVSPFHEFLSGMNFILQINVGVVKLTGASGTGKTALLQELVRSTRHAQQDIISFYTTPASFQEIKNAIREQLNLDPAVNFHDAVLNHILARPFEQRRLTVVIDNAELMDEATLLAVGHLRTIRNAGQSLIGLVLCGSPELNRIIRQAEHHLLAHDILLSYELSPLSSQQLPDFCRGCFAARGLDGFALVADDYKQIMEQSQGLPGKVAELVETYWPEDPEISASALSANDIAFVPSALESATEQQNVFEPQTTAILENTKTVSESIFFTSPARSNIAPDVTPVISPDLSFEFLTESSREPAGDVAATIEQFAVDAPNIVTNFEAPAAAFAASSEFIANEPAFSTPDVATQLPADAAAFATDTAAMPAPDPVAVSPDPAYANFADTTTDMPLESQLDFASGFTPHTSYNGSADVAPATASNISGEFAGDGFAGQGQDGWQQQPTGDANFAAEPYVEPVANSTQEMPQEFSSSFANDVFAPNTSEVLQQTFDPSNNFAGEAGTSSFTENADGVPQEFSSSNTSTPVTENAYSATQASASETPANVASETWCMPVADSWYETPPAYTGGNSTDAFNADMHQHPQPTAADTGSSFVPDAADAASTGTQPQVAQPPPSEFLTEISASIVYITAPAAASRIAAATANAAADGARDAAPEVASGIVAETAGGGADELIPAQPADIPHTEEVANASDAFSEATYDVSPEPLTEVSFDFSSDTPVEIALGLAPEPAPADAPQETAEVITPVAAAIAPAAPTRPAALRMIVGALIAASIAVVVVQILKTDSDTAATPAANVQEPAPVTPTQTANDTTIATVNVQQFGEPAVPAPPTISGEVVPQPLPITPVQPSDVQPLPVPAAPSTTTAETAPVAAPAGPTSAAAIATVAEGVVNAWIDAWESQNVDAYLAFYHRDFVPPKGASRDGWENNRDRIISSQSSISIDMEDFMVLGTSGNQTRVQFRLTYRGDNYADRTLKELTLQPDANGELRIVQEQNLQTEAFDPVIEAAASWMPDSARVRAQINGAGGSTSQVQPGVLAAVPADAQPIDSVAGTEVSQQQAAGAAIIPLIFNLTTLTEAEVGEVNGVLQAWAAAWQSKNLEQYFSHYHADYKAPEAATVAQWRDERSARIAAANQITISLNELEILQNNDDNLLLELLMEYRTDTYADRTLKRMMLSKSAQGQWLITMESNIEVEQL